jgi:hypothetical protein
MVTPDASHSAAYDGRLRGAALALACAALAFIAAAAQGPALASAAKASQATFDSDAKRARNWLAQRLDKKLKHRIVIQLLDHDLGIKDGKRITARTTPMSRESGDWVPDLKEPYERCVIRVSKHVRYRPRPYRRGTLSHEVTHCFQYEAMGLKGVPQVDSRQWLTDGSAEWASYKYVNDAWNGWDNWDAYMSAPRRTLYRRTYDAVGFFSHIDRRTRDQWRVVWRMWQAWARENPIPERHRAAFRVAQQAAGNAGLAQTWATSFARRKDLGGAWEMHGPGLPPPVGQREPDQLTVDDGPRVDRLLPAAVGLWRLVAPKGAVVRVRGKGYATLHLAGKGDTRTPDVRLEGDYSTTYCVQECVCPDGSNLGRRIAVAAGGPTYLAHTGGATSGRSEVRRLSTEEACGITAHPCNWGFGVPAVTAWIKAMVDDPSRPVEGVTGEPGLGGFPEDLGARGCYWISSFGDQVWIVEALDRARLRQHLTTLARVAVGDEGWIDPFRGGSEYDVYFRVGHKYVVAAIWTTRTDPDEAVEFATAVATAARVNAPPCC